MQQIFTWLPVLLVVMIGLIGLAVLLKKRTRSMGQRTDRKGTATSIDDSLTSLCRYFDTVNARRTFPVVPLDAVKPKKGEFGLINERANLYEMRAHRQSVGVSVRVARGADVGRRSYISKDHLDRTAVGVFILTRGHYTKVL
jgi:hypothetical protein